MTTVHLGERTLELLCDRSLQGLSPAEEAELTTLLGQGFGQDDGSFDLAVAKIHLAELSSAALEPMPSHLRDAVVGRAALAASTAGSSMPANSMPANSMPGSSMAGSNVIPMRAATPASRPAARSRAGEVVPWLFAAACLLLFVGAVVYRGMEPVVRAARVVPLPAPSAPASNDVPVPPSAARERQALVDTSKDVVVIPFKATDDPAAKGASGDVVFSPSEQRGYMRFVGLAPNDPKLTQYQLWIFDEERDEKYPVDGGVFDIGEGGEVVVPITPRVRVGKAKLFAVTVEKPGGVVVSKRERIVTTAAVAG